MPSSPPPDLSSLADLYAQGQIVAGSVNVNAAITQASAPWASVSPKSGSTSQGGPWRRPPSNLAGAASSGTAGAGAGRRPRLPKGAVIVIVVILAILALLATWRALQYQSRPATSPPSPPAAPSPPSAPTQPPSAPTAPSPPSASQPDARQLQRADEQGLYSLAQGSLSALQNYRNVCRICEFDGAARDEIARLQAVADSERQRRLEEQNYLAARGNLSTLRDYVNTCKKCEYMKPATAEIDQLQPRRRAGTSNACGREVSYVVDPTGLAEQYRPFVGVWTGAAWNSRICGTLFVESISGDGTANIRYVYGPLPGQNFSWKIQSQRATITGNTLTFQDEERGTFTFFLNGNDTLRGHFVSISGTTLEATLRHDPSSVP